MLSEHKSDFIEAMAGAKWIDKSGEEHDVPHISFIEKHIRSLKHVKYYSYFGEYFSCNICLEIAMSFKALVTALKITHLY